MGCGESKVLAVYQREEIRAKRELYEALNFTELDIGRLHSVYRKIDNDNSNSIELAELLAFLDLDRTRFTKRIFTMFDEDKSGLLDFNEFVLSLWNYCTLTKASLELFAFDLYDEDNSGSITQNEVLNMLKDLYGNPGYRKNPQARLIASELEALERLDGDVDVGDFREYSRTHPALLFLAFQVQEKIQTRVLGPVFWKYYSDKRIEISKGRLYVPIYEFVEIFVNVELQKALLTDNIGMGNAIDKRDIGFVPQKKLDGALSSKAKLILDNTGSAAHRLKPKGGGKGVGKGVGVDGEGHGGSELDDCVHTLRKLYEEDAANKTAARRQSTMSTARRGSVMTIGDNYEGSAGQKGIYKKRNKRRSFDNLAHEKSKALYEDSGMFTLKDSHVHSVQEALMLSSQLQKDNAQGFDPIKHNKMVEELKSFSVEQAMQPAYPGNAGRRASVAHASVVGAKPKSKRRSFDNGHYANPGKKGGVTTVRE